jgi:hypothetical protein
MVDLLLDACTSGVGEALVGFLLLLSSLFLVDGFDIEFLTIRLTSIPGGIMV